MPWQVEAVYENGVFRPLEPLPLPEGTLVFLTIKDDEPVIVEVRRCRSEGETKTIARE